VQVLTNKPEAFSFVANIEKISFSGDFAYIKFKNVDYEAAQNMRNTLIQIPRDKLPLDDDEVLADDLIGFEVVNVDGKKLGVVKSVDSNVDCGNIEFPYEDVFVIETNMKTRQIIIRAEMLDEETIL